MADCGTDIGECPWCENVSASICDGWRAHIKSEGAKEMKAKIVAMLRNNPELARYLDGDESFIDEIERGE